MGLPRGGFTVTVTIDVVSIPEGQHSTITLAKTGADSGQITVDGQSYDLTDIKASADGLGLICSGPLGATVTCTIHPSPPPKTPFISIEIRSFFFHSTKNYQVTSTNQKKLSQFISASFPQVA
jgi:hypothetical protein